jgi:septal ring factor EnvC (AmiA/AmiB activator)
MDLLSSLKKKANASSPAPKKKNSPLFGRLTEDALNDKEFDQFDEASTETAALLEDVALRKERVAALEEEIVQTKARMADLMNEINDLQGELQEELQMFDQHRSMRQMSRDEGLDSLLAAEKVCKDQKRKKYEVNITEKEVPCPSPSILSQYINAFLFPVGLTGPQVQEGHHDQGP